MMLIPAALQKEEHRFCLLKPNDKIPFEKSWQSRGYKFNDEKLQQHILKSNYGVIGGYGNLRILDIDDPQVAKHFKKLLNTFTVRTGGGGYHFYFYSDYDINHKLKNNAGEWRAMNCQVVGPSCKHPNGNYYEIVNDSKIQKVSADIVLDILEPFIRDPTDPDPRYDGNTKPSDTSIQGLEFKKQSRSEDEWHEVCELVKKGFTDEQIDKHMRENKFEKWLEHVQAYRDHTIKKARQEIGIAINSIGSNPTRVNFKIISDAELASYEAPKTEWLIPNFIKPGTTTFIIGRPHTLKSWVANEMAMSLVTGKKLFDHFEVKQKTNVLMIDSETDYNELQRRRGKVAAGLGIDQPLDGMFYLSETSVNLMSRPELIQLEQFITSKKIGLVICDAYRRFIRFDENDNTNTNLLFTEFLKPLFHRTKIAMLFVHHRKKGNEREMDPLDSLRGASDIAANADFIFEVARKGKLITMNQIKCKSAKQLETFSVNIENGKNDEYMKLMYGGEIMNRANKAAELLLIWISKNKLSAFKYGAAIQFLKESNVSESAAKEALILLQDQGRIQKGERRSDPYEVLDM